MRGARNSRSFTLVELLIVTVIIGVLATSTLFALYGAMEQARAVRTRAQIVRLQELIMDRWEQYTTRKVPVLLTGGSPMDRARFRLHALRDLMRMELPDRITDVLWAPTPFVIDPANPNSAVGPSIPQPPLWRTHRRRALHRQFVGQPGLVLPPPNSVVGIEIPAFAVVTDESDPQNPGWTTQHQGAECLYLIISSIQGLDKPAIEFFGEAEIGDTDEDGRQEILDGWGRPIYFLRWAPGFATSAGIDGAPGIAMWDDNQDGNQDERPNQQVRPEYGAFGTDDRSELQVKPYPRGSNPVVWVNEAPDPLDPLHVDPRWNDQIPGNEPFALFPLIYSAGPDGKYEIASDNEPNGLLMVYPATTLLNDNLLPNDPYFNPGSGGTPDFSLYPLGSSFGAGSDDNITNHLLDAE